MAETEMATPWGTYVLRRPHADRRSPMRAWSAADAYALEHLAREHLQDARERDGAGIARVLVVGDSWGGLTVPLAHRREIEVTLWSDSAASRRAVADNLAQPTATTGTATTGTETTGTETAGEALPVVTMVPGDEQPSGPWDLVVVAVPKSLDLLNHQLRVVGAGCEPGTPVVGAAMARHVHNSTVEAFASNIGPTETTLARRKARLLLATARPNVATARPDAACRALGAPTAGSNDFVTGEGVVVRGLPGVFSAGRLDPATELLLDVLAEIEPPRPDAHVVDLGCGNGVIAATLARRWPDTAMTLVDVSDLAVASARSTWQANGLDERQARFVVADGLLNDEVEAASLADLVVSNLPIHTGHGIDRDLVPRLLRGAAHALAPGGTCVVVASRRLHVHTLMKRHFVEVATRSGHPEFVVVTGVLGARS